MSPKHGPTVWSRDACQWIPCFDRCQLNITWMSNIKDLRCYPRLGISWSMATGATSFFTSLSARPAIDAVNHVDHEKSVAWFSISMHECVSVAIVEVLRSTGRTSAISKKVKYINIKI